MLCSSRFSSNKGALKELFVVLFVSTCLKRKPKENLKKNIWFVLSVSPPLQFTTLYNGQTHSLKIGWDWDVLYCSWYWGTVWALQLEFSFLLSDSLWNVGLLSKFLSVEWIIFLSDLTRELGWVGDCKKKRKLLWTFTAVVQTDSK